MVSAPVGGFYFSNDWPYRGSSPPPKSFIPWTYEALAGYAALWDAFVPRRCAAQQAGGQAHRCMFAQASYASTRGAVFVIEAQTFNDMAKELNALLMLHTVGSWSNWGIIQAVECVIPSAATELMICDAQERLEPASSPEPAPASPRSP